MGGRRSVGHYILGCISSTSSSGVVHIRNITLLCLISIMEKIRKIMWWITDIVSVVFFASVVDFAGLDSFTLTSGEMELLVYATFIATAYNMTYKIPKLISGN